MILNSMVTSSSNQSTYELAHDWIEMTHQCLMDIGCVQTLDVGQYISPQTTGAISTATTLGYRIYEINDEYSGIQPIYLKLSFRVVGSHSTFSVNPIGVYILTIGFETDGSGNIIGATAPTALQLYTPTNVSSPLTQSTIGAKTFAVKGSSFMYLGGQIGMSYQSSYNFNNSGFFGILRNIKYDGSVNPELITVIYPPTSSGLVQQALRYQKLSKTFGASIINTSMHALPRIQSTDGLLLALEADISEQSILETTDTLVSIRNNSASPWSTYRLSIDGVTSYTYLHVITIESNSIPSAARVPFNATVDTREYTGCLGLIWSE